VLNILQVFVEANTKTANMTIEYSSEPEYPVVLRGANKDDTVGYPDTTQYQATVITNRNYRIRFSDPSTPSWIELSAHNFPQFVLDLFSMYSVRFRLL